MRVITIPALADNYIFLVLDDLAPEAAVVDPGTAEPVIEYLQKTGRKLSAILSTHHHRDHTGGNRALLEHFPGIPVFGSAGDRGRIPGQNRFVSGGDSVPVAGKNAEVLDVPGHTRAHIAYYFPSGAGEGDLFSGDTVFGGTIGNLFEGTPEVMFQSIQKIRALPRKTRIWCAHEYTLQYVRESARIDPKNALLAKRLESLESVSSYGRPTVPLLLEEECGTNPFFRWDDPELNAFLSKEPGFESFRYLCEIT
jgi:hydroxyacylglutathione hydrolase